MGCPGWVVPSGAFLWGCLARVFPSLKHVFTVSVIYGRAVFRVAVLRPIGHDNAFYLLIFPHVARAEFKRQLPFFGLLRCAVFNLSVLRAEVVALAVSEQS